MVPIPTFWDSSRTLTISASTEYTLAYSNSSLYVRAIKQDWVLQNHLLESDEYIRSLCVIDTTPLSQRYIVRFIRNEYWGLQIRYTMESWSSQCFVIYLSSLSDLQWLMSSRNEYETFYYSWELCSGYPWVPGYAVTQSILMRDKTGAYFSIKSVAILHEVQSVLESVTDWFYLLDKLIRVPTWTMCSWFSSKLLTDSSQTSISLVNTEYPSFMRFPLRSKFMPER